ncbi:MAG: hypothetical protein EPN97_02355 [Alphaproteobacteria bacterium]|nr:MAG: hypothetical protein EPN97_02355 [Alphaproteobacteria bacterium]
MSGTEENMPAMDGPAAPFSAERKPGWKSPWFFIFAAAAAAIFIYDAALYDKIHSPPPPPQPVVFSSMRHSVIQASSGFQALVATVCWILGAGILLSGSFKVFGAWRRRKRDPAPVPRGEKALLYLLLGVGLMAYPFVYENFRQSYGYYEAYYHPYYGYTQEKPNTANFRTFAFYSLYFGTIAFLFGSFALKKAQRLKDDPAAPALKDKAAFRFTAGFIMTALPFACASFMGVDLW